MIYLISLFLFLLLSLYNCQFTGPISLAFYTIFNKVFQSIENYESNHTRQQFFLYQISRLHSSLFFVVFNLFLIIDGSSQLFIYNSISISVIFLHEIYQVKNYQNIGFILLPLSLLFPFFLGIEYLSVTFLTISLMNTTKIKKLLIILFSLLLILNIDFNSFSIDSFNLKSSLKYFFSVIFLIYLVFPKIMKDIQIFDLIFYSLLIIVYLTVIGSMQKPDFFLFFTVSLLTLIFRIKFEVAPIEN